MYKLLPINIKQFDAAVTLDAVKKFLSDNKDQDAVKAYLGELSAVSADKVKGFLDTEEGKKIVQPKLDAHFTKSLETWKTNNLETLINDEVNKRNPGKSPEQIKIEELTKKIEDAEKARNREALVNKALKVAKEKNLPDGVIDFFIGENEEGTIANLTKLEEEYTKAVQAAVDIKFKENGRIVTTGGGGTNSGSIDIGALAADASIRK
ncbi:DUF4355 domain-containing protein [Metabacillus idriensis]|uniref:DUF4355 domain-containing protein n=1 Tax=Metabacillus idriensis TaxID=324768 RepID=UPI001748D411|nr:DUF4355 domain-containing protein [Metabacillus idriensis]